MPKKIIIKYAANRTHFNDISSCMFLEDNNCCNKNFKNNMYEISNIAFEQDEEEEYLPQLSFLKDQSTTNQI